MFCLVQPRQRVARQHSFRQGVLRHGKHRGARKRRIFAPAHGIQHQQHDPPRPAGRLRARNLGILQHLRKRLPMDVFPGRRGHRHRLERPLRRHRILQFHHRRHRLETGFRTDRQRTNGAEQHTRTYVSDAGTVVQPAGRAFLWRLRCRHGEKRVLRRAVGHHLRLQQKTRPRLALRRLRQDPEGHRAGQTTARRPERFAQLHDPEPRLRPGSRGPCPAADGQLSRSAEKGQ